MELIGNSISVTENYGGVSYCSNGSPPSGAHSGGWEDLGEDGGEPLLHLSIMLDFPSS